MAPGNLWKSILMMMWMVMMMMMVVVVVVVINGDDTAMMPVNMIMTKKVFYQRCTNLS